MMIPLFAIIYCICCLSQVYVTMYLNDCQRTAFYEGIGLDTKEFDMHVIIEVRLSLQNIMLILMNECTFI